MKTLADNEISQKRNSEVTIEALRLIDRERIRQDEKWGQRNHDNVTWLAILTEEVGELAEQTLEEKFGTLSSVELISECVHVTAVGLAMLECLIRNGYQTEILKKAE